MIAKDKKFLFFVVYSIILVFTVCISYTFISSYIKEKQEFEQFKQTWQYRADTNFTQSIEIDEETGEQTVVYEISTPEQLAGMSIHSKNVKADSNQKVKYQLKQSLDLSGYNWSSANTSSSDFDGDGFVISGLTSAYVDNLTGTVENLILTDVSISTSGNAGAVANSSSGTIKNVQVVSSTKTSSVEGESCVGGLVGSMSSGSIINCSNKSSVSGGYSIGGIVGEMSGGSIANCRNYGSISPSSASELSAGGIVGNFSGTSISQCYNDSSINGSGTSTTNIGGIVGKSTGSISMCMNTGSMTGGEKYNTGSVYVGGIAGYSSSSISTCHNKGSVSAYSADKGEETKEYTGPAAYLIKNPGATNAQASFQKLYLLGHFNCGTGAKLENVYCWQGWAKYNSKFPKGSQKEYYKQLKCHKEYAGGIVGYGSDSVSNCYNQSSSINIQGTTEFEFQRILTADVRGDAVQDCYSCVYYCKVTGLYLNKSGINGNKEKSTTNCFSVPDETENKYNIEYSVVVNDSSEEKIESKVGSSFTYNTSGYASSTKIEFEVSGSVMYGFRGVTYLRITCDTKCSISGSEKNKKSVTVDPMNYPFDDICIKYYCVDYLFDEDAFNDAEDGEPSSLQEYLGYSWGDNSSKGGLYLTGLYW